MAFIVKLNIEEKVLETSIEKIRCDILKLQQKNKELVKKINTLEESYQTNSSNRSETKDENFDETSFDMERLNEYLVGSDKENTEDDKRMMQKKL